MDNYIKDAVAAAIKDINAKKEEKIREEITLNNKNVVTPEFTRLNKERDDKIAVIRKESETQIAAIKVSAEKEESDVMADYSSRKREFQKQEEDSIRLTHGAKADLVIDQLKASVGIIGD